MKKLLILLIIVSMVVAPNAAFAATWSTQSTKTITASGTLTAVTDFSVSATSISFSPTQSDLTPVSSLVTLTFNNNKAATYKAIIIDSNNTEVTINNEKVTPAGLQGVDVATLSVPLRVKTFNGTAGTTFDVAYKTGTVTDENNSITKIDDYKIYGSTGYKFEDDVFENEEEYEDESIEGDKVASFVIDKADITNASADDLAATYGVATVVAGVNGKKGNIAAYVPYRDGFTAATETAYLKATEITDGKAYLLIEADYTSAAAQEYKTSLKVEVISMV